MATLLSLLVHFNPLFTSTIFGVTVAFNSTVFVPLKSNVTFDLFSVTPFGLVCTFISTDAVFHVVELFTVILTVPFTFPVTTPL